LSEEQQREQTNQQMLMFVAMKPGSEAFLKV
jgi:hypothetical protein